MFLTRYYASRKKPHKIKINVFQKKYNVSDSNTKNHPKIKTIQKICINNIFEKTDFDGHFMKTLSNRNENGKFENSNPDLPKLKWKKSLCECFTVNSTLLYLN